MFHTYIAPMLQLIFGSLAGLSVLSIFVIAQGRASQQLTRAEAYEGGLTMAVICIACCAVCWIVSYFDRVE